MTSMVSAAAAAMIFLAAAGAAPAKKKGAPTPSPAEPVITVTVPAPCADVWKHVYTDFDASWKVTVLPPSQEDEAPPEPEVLDAFVARVPGLADAVRRLDAVDRDIFFIRLQTKSLAELRKAYPKLKPELLEAAKTDRCRNAAAR